MAQKKSKSIVTDIVLIDIINFSKLTSTQQLEIVVFLTKIYKKMLEKMLLSSNMSLSKLILGFVSTGDGFYTLLNPRLRGFGSILALSFHHFAESISDRYEYFEGIRIAVHTGEINEFIDILEHKNYIGDGLNDCARYLEIKDFTVSTTMVSEAAYESLRRFIQVHKEFNTILARMEFKYSNTHTFVDKHDNTKEGRLIWLRKPGVINPPNTNLNSIV